MSENHQESVTEGSLKKIGFLTHASIIAALYAVLTALIEPLSYGPFQCRISEALTVLPILTPAAVPGLWAGCVLSNLLGPYGITDAIFGSFFTLVAACGTYFLRRYTILALSMPVLVNSLGVALYLHMLTHVPYGATVMTIAVGEAVSVYVLGALLLVILRKHHLLS